MPFDASCKASPYVLKDTKLSSHGRILQFMESLPRQTKVLDVGTATGYLGERLQCMGFENLSGIEIDALWASKARDFYKEVIECDIEKEELPWARETFYVIICADILEHAKCPEILLEKLRSLIARDGYVLVSLPNIAHWSVRLGLLFGRFEYTASGILDRTHLRFFTLRSARSLIQTTGFEIERSFTTPLPFSLLRCGKLQDMFWRFAEALDNLMCRVCPTFFAYQFVFVARPKPEGV